MVKFGIILLTLAGTVNAFVAPQRSLFSTSLFGWFDNWSAQGSGKDDLDEQWEQQQEILRQRRKPKAERQAYFAGVEKKRAEASDEQQRKWAWQTKTYGKGEDPLDEWKRRREDGTIDNLDNQYGDPREVGGIPFPMPSFGVGGEFGVGGKFDNGGRFDLRLPYADQGYVDEDADVMGRISSWFRGGRNKAIPKEEKNSEDPKKKKWPWEQ